MTTVFFLFLTHLSLGILAALPFVPDRAGRGFFKFCSAASAFMTTAAVWLRFRRVGFDEPLVLGLVGLSLAFMVFYNRAHHFGWTRPRRAFLAGALVSGLAGVLVAAPAHDRVLVWATDLTSIVLLGAAGTAMVLGHYYLVVLDLPITALRRLTKLLALGLILRAVVVAIALSGPAQAAYEGARLVAIGTWSSDGVFVWMRILFGIVGPFTLIGFIWKTVELRSTQSATGILYVQLFLVMSGELLAKYLRVATGMPL